MHVFESYDELSACVGREVGRSDWVEVTQARIDHFADATGDHQWIHVDPARAAVESPFGATIAHGYMTLSLIPEFIQQVYTYGPKTASLNYGLDKVRFVEPVIAGSRLRGVFRCLEVGRDAAGRVRLKMQVTVEIEGRERPACVAETITLYVTE